jgi:hypothetical protein
LASSCSQSASAVGPSRRFAAPQRFGGCRRDGLADFGAAPSAHVDLAGDSSRDQSGPALTQKSTSFLDFSGEIVESLSSRLDM